METTPLAAIRKRRHLTQEEVASRIGVDVTTVYRWEHGTSKPYPVHIRRLCDLFETTASTLGLEEECKPVPIAYKDNNVTMFLANDLTMRLLTLAFLPHKDYQSVQSALRHILEEDTMNELTRREALSRLATLPMLTLGLHTSRANYTDMLNQCAASIAACWELGRSSDQADIKLAFDAIAAFIPSLKAIVKESSKHRQSAAGLVAQCELLRTVLGWHFVGICETISYGQQAVLYSEQAADISLQLSALKCLAWSYYYDHHHRAAAQTMEQAASLLKEHKASLPSYTHSNILGTLALMASSAGGVDTILRAEKGLTDGDYPVYVDPPVSAFLRNAGMALYHQRQYDSALAFFDQLVDTETLKAKRPLPERTRIEVINAMALASVKSPQRDLELTLHYFDAGIRGAASLQSNQRYNEARSVYEIAEAIWPHEQRIKDRWPAVVH